MLAGAHAAEASDEARLQLRVLAQVHVEPRRVRPVGALDGEIPAAEDGVGEPGRVFLPRRERHCDDGDEQSGDEHGRASGVRCHGAHYHCFVEWAARVRGARLTGSRSAPAAPTRRFRGARRARGSAAARAGSRSRTSRPPRSAGAPDGAPSAPAGSAAPSLATGFHCVTSSCSMRSSRQRRVVRRDVDQAKTIGHAGTHANRRGRRPAVQRERLALARRQHAVQADHHDVIGLRIVALAGLEHDQRRRRGRRQAAPRRASACGR